MTTIDTVFCIIPHATLDADVIKKIPYSYKDPV